MTDIKLLVACQGQSHALPSDVKSSMQAPEAVPVRNASHEPQQINRVTVIVSDREINVGES
jgi:hypothetical protein